MSGGGVSKSFVLWPRPWGCLHRRARCRGREEGGPGAQATSGAPECFCYGHSGSVLASSCGQESGGGREVRRAVRTPAATHPPAGAGKTPRHGDPVCKGSLGEVIVINSRSLIPRGLLPPRPGAQAGGGDPGVPCTTHLLRSRTLSVQNPLELAKAIPCLALSHRARVACLAEAGELE